MNNGKALFQKGRTLIKIINRSKGYCCIRVFIRSVLHTHTHTHMMKVTDTQTLSVTTVAQLVTHTHTHTHTCMCACICVTWVCVCGFACVCPGQRHDSRATGRDRVTSWQDVIIRHDCQSVSQSVSPLRSLAKSTWRAEEYRRPPSCRIISLRP